MVSFEGSGCKGTGFEGSEEVGRVEKQKSGKTCCKMLINNFLQQIFPLKRMKEGVESCFFLLFRSYVS